MRVPQPLKAAEDRGIVVTTFEDGDGEAIVVDLGFQDDAAIDVLDGVVIAVVGDRQFEFELPPEATDVTVNNGVLTIRE